MTKMHIKKLKTSHHVKGVNTYVYIHTPTDISRKCLYSRSIYKGFCLSRQ